MTLVRMILPKWALHHLPDRHKVIEGLFSDEQIKEYNDQGYNAYYLPNGPSDYNPDVTVDGSHIDDFSWVFVDFDLKSGTYSSKDDFIEAVGSCGIEPTKIVDSGNGIHVYWKVLDLDAKSYLRFQRRFMRLLNTDEAVGQLFQLMRLPGTMNTKTQGAYVPCELLIDTGEVYTCENLDKLLPTITLEDEAYCNQHYDRTYKLNQDTKEISDKLPLKFGRLLKENHEAKELWSGNVEDRSKSDYRLGHIMFGNGFTKDEALSVLVNSAKAIERAPVHRRSYAENIVSKIWTFEEGQNESLTLSSSVKDILKRPSDTNKGQPFRCNKLIDNTTHGFRLGQVLGLVAGSGVGKTAYALNMFKWFAETNPDYHHFFVPLEQPAGEIY